MSGSVLARLASPLAMELQPLMESAHSQYYVPGIRHGIPVPWHRVSGFPSEDQQQTYLVIQSPIAVFKFSVYTGALAPFQSSGVSAVLSPTPYTAMGDCTGVRAPVSELNIMPGIKCTVLPCKARVKVWQAEPRAIFGRISELC